MFVKKLVQDAILPKRSSDGAAGYDLFCSEDVVFSGSVVVKIKTGIALEMTDVGMYAQIHTRSSLALQGLTVVGGVIDSDYRGEIVVLMNCSESSRKDGTVLFKKGMKVAQLIFHKIEIPILEEKEELSETARGEKGFGSTGV